MDYRRLASLAEYRDKARAKKVADQTEDAGLLFRLDRGSKSEDTRRGLVTLYCLRGEGESLQDAYDDGVRSDMFQQRISEQQGPRIRLVDGQKVGFSTPVLLAA
jgi:hypothetical protein